MYFFRACHLRLTNADTRQSTQKWPYCMSRKRCAREKGENYPALGIASGFNTRSLLGGLVFMTTVFARLVFMSSWCLLITNGNEENINFYKSGKYATIGNKYESAWVVMRMISAHCNPFCLWTREQSRFTCWYGAGMRFYVIPTGGCWKILLCESLTMNALTKLRTSALWNSITNGI